MSEPDRQLGGKTGRGIRDTRLAEHTPGALAHIKDPVRPADRSAGRNRPRPQGQPD